MSKHIFSKIAKIGEEVRTHKVELSLVSELITRIQESKERVNSLRDAEVKLLNVFDEASRLAKELDSEYAFANSLTKVISNSIDRTETAAKELGLDVNSIKEVKDMRAAEQDLLTALTKAENTIKAYRSLR